MNTRRRRSIDADELADLERERTFLLSSLDDLDAEYRAGDLDQADYESLNDDYTRRTAEVIRAIDEQREAFAERAAVSTPRSQRILTIAAVVIVAVLAGVLLAQASGFRSPTDSATGDIRRSSAGLLAEADTLTREGRWPEAIEVYDEVLENSPANVEALTYRGWITSRLGDSEAGLVDIQEAVAVDPDFADARVFNAILLDDAQRFDEAAEQLRVLDTLELPDQIAGLVSQSNLRGSVAAGQIVDRFGAGGEIDLDQINSPLDDIATGGLLLDELDPLLALRVFDAVLEEDPTNVRALVGNGRRLAADPGIYASDPEVAARGLSLLDRAVEQQPANPEVRLYRALARLVQQDPAGAQADLDAIDQASLDDQLRELFGQIESAL